MRFAPEACWGWGGESGIQFEAKWPKMHSDSFFFRPAFSRGPGQLAGFAGRRRLRGGAASRFATRWRMAALVRTLASPRLPASACSRSATRLLKIVDGVWKSANGNERLPRTPGTVSGAPRQEGPEGRRFRRAAAVSIRSWALGEAGRNVAICFGNRVHTQMLGCHSRNVSR